MLTYDILIVGGGLTGLRAAVGLCDKFNDGLISKAYPSRFPDGTIAQRPFGGGGFPRTCFSADITGHSLLNTLYERAVYKKVKIYPEWFVVDLCVEDGQCHGVIVLDIKSGKLIAVRAKVTLFGTGGYGRGLPQY